MYIKTTLGMERVNVQSITSIRITEDTSQQFVGTMFNICIEQYGSNHLINLLFIDKHDVVDFMEKLYLEITRTGAPIIDVSDLAAFVDCVDDSNKLPESENTQSFDLGE